MKSVSRFACEGILAITAIGLLVALADGQNPGNNAVYNPSNGVTFSVSFIDARRVAHLFQVLLLITNK